jgi:phosphatidylglycerophosphate synthase
MSFAGPSPHPSLWQRLSDEYKRSLKAPELEERLDLFLFRPLGFVVAKLLARTRVSADQVSLGSLAAGLAAGVLLWMSPEHGTAGYGAACYFVCAALDCADGQLARLRGSSSPVGYIIDGSIDYAATLAVFAGMTHAVAATHPGAAWPWLLGLVALAVMGWHCAVVDRMRHAWSAHALGRRHDPDAEIAEFRAQAAAWQRVGGHLGGRALVALYLFYRAGWARFTPPAAGRHGVDAAWAARHQPVLRMAVLAGSTFHMTAIMIAALAGRLELYLWSAIVLGSAWTTCLVLRQKHAAGLDPRDGGASAPDAVGRAGASKGGSTCAS